MKKRTTSNGSDWEKICREIYCLKLAQLIKSANRLHIFGIRSFDNTKYFKIDKWISLREICIEIDHFAIQPFPLLRAILPPAQLLTFCWLLAQQKVGPNFLLRSAQQKVERAKLAKNLKVFSHRTSRTKSKSKKFQKLNFYFYFLLT